MRYLKFYESKYESNFWLISTDTIQYKLSLDKISVPKNNEYYDYDMTKWGDKIYFSKSFNRYGIVYEWNESDCNGYSNFIENGYKYMGEIIIPDDIIDAYKYNL